MHADILNIFDVFVMTTKTTQNINLPVVGHGLPTAKILSAD